MQSMQLCICSSNPFEDTHENSLWRQIIQMQPMQLCIKSGIPFETTFENSLKKNIQMQTIRPCIYSRKQFEGTFQNSLTLSLKQLSCGPSLAAVAVHVGKFRLYLVFKHVADSDSDSMHGFLCFLRFLVYQNTALFSTFLSLQGVTSRLFLII